jgi:hypothetical protein
MGRGESHPDGSPVLRLDTSLHTMDGLPIPSRRQSTATCPTGNQSCRPPGPVEGKWDVKDPLYRRVNTRARNVHHRHGGDYRHRRNTERERGSDETRGSMRGRRRRGLDYTPLFKFLLARVGDDWDDVYGEAAARLDTPDPIFWMVARHEHERRDSIRVGESTYYSGLYIDADNRLRVVDPDLGPDTMEPGGRPGGTRGSCAISGRCIRARSSSWSGWGCPGSSR